MTTIPIRKDVTVQLELIADDLVLQTQKILEIRDKAMKDGVHYGIIPGTKKPSLFKPGAERLCKAFRLEPEFETISHDDPNRTINWKKWDYKNRKEIEGTTRGYMECNSHCTLIHIPTEEVWAKHVGASCNNFESRYRSLNPYDVKNTLRKMSEKRALVAAVLVGTAASDIFTQDVEDLPQLINGDTSDNKPVHNTGSNNVRMATDKQVSYLKKIINKNGIKEDKFFEEWEDYFTSWDTIPFSVVNDILEWIQE